MTTDPILDELHQTRRRLLAEANGTLEGLVATLRKRQQDSDRRILSSQGTALVQATGLKGERMGAATPDPREERSDSGSD